MFAAKDTGRISVIWLPERMIVSTPMNMSKFVTCGPMFWKPRRIIFRSAKSSSLYTEKKKLRIIWKSFNKTYVGSVKSVPVAAVVTDLDSSSSLSFSSSLSSTMPACANSYRASFLIEIGLVKQSSLIIWILISVGYWVTFNFFTSFYRFTILV